MLIIQHFGALPRVSNTNLYNIKFEVWKEKDITVFVSLAAQGAYQSHFGWALIKTLSYV